MKKQFENQIFSQRWEKETEITEKCLLLEFRLGLVITSDFECFY